MPTAEQYDKISENASRLANLKRRAKQIKQTANEEVGEEVFKPDEEKMLAKTLYSDFVMSEYDEINTLCDVLKINASEARKRLDKFPPEYTVEDKNIPDLIKQMRMSRRKLKGEHREDMAKAIDTMIDAYSDHLFKCFDSIYWLAPYKEPLLKMRFNEKDLRKLHKMKSVEERREVVDALCKYWEAETEQNGMVYGKDYATLAKEMKLAKKSFRETIAKVSNQSLAKSKKERQRDFILKAVCENHGIGARLIHDMMPTDLHKASSPRVISQEIKKLGIVSVDGAFYKIPDEIKKNIWAYTAAFIDSDGYITLDRKMNPRVGLVATGERGKAFMQEMHKSIGFGRMHLDQKSPQDTRLINRLNFYSQDDVSNLLEKCLPHFRLKKGNAKLLLELIRMKKSYKKEDWYKSRCDEIFKLMKWENHKDHVGFDWAKENINLDDIQKYKDNCKMSVMDSLEQIGGMQNVV